MDSMANVAHSLLSRSMDSMAPHAKRAALMWLTGFREACCVHRAVLFCIRSRALSIRTGQILLLNGLFFLGSLSVLSSFVIPILLWILPSQCEQFGSELCDHEAAMSFYSSLRFLLIVLFYVFWFWPLCFLCYLLGSIWYGDIAKHAFDVVRGQGSSLEPQNHVQMGRPVGFEGAILGIGEKIYSFLLLNIFWLEVFATGYIPYIGKALSFLLLSWMYAYYFFEYKWDHSELSLDERLDLFESNWAFFAGFGSPCALVASFVSGLVNWGILAILFPLFVLTAAGTKAEQLDSLKMSLGGPGKCQIFYIANNLSMLVLQFRKFRMLVLQFYRKVFQKVPKDQ